MGLGDLLNLGRPRIGYRPGGEVVVLGTEAEGDQRRELSFPEDSNFCSSGSVESIHGILVPYAGGLIGLEIAAGSQGILNLL